MKTLNINGEKIKAERIVKTNSDIVGYDVAGKELFTFRGISDFSLFNLEQGQIWDIDEKEQFTILKNKLMTDDERYKSLDKTTALLADLKAAKLAQLDELCNQAIINGFDFTVNNISYRFSCSINAQANFQGTDTLFKDGLITSAEWTVINNTTGSTERITLNQTIFNQIKLQVFMHINSNVSKLRNTLQPQVVSALTNVEVDAVVW